MRNRFGPILFIILVLVIAVIVAGAFAKGATLIPSSSEMLAVASIPHVESQTGGVKDMGKELNYLGIFGAVFILEIAIFMGIKKAQG